jgi:hypothetical protein
MKMQKNIYAIMTAAMAASAVLVSSCTKDENAEPPVITLEKTTFAPTEPIKGTIVAGAGLKMVKLQKQMSSSSSYSDDGDIIKGVDRFNISNGAGYASDPVHLQVGKETEYNILITPSARIKGSTLGSFTGGALGSQDDYDVPATFPVGKYRFCVQDKNNNIEYEEFEVAVAAATSTPPCSALTDAMLLAGLASGEGMATTAWHSATDSIKAEGNYFFQRSSTSVQYGIVKVKKLDADSAVLTLLFLNAQGGTDSTGTATIYTATNKPSFFVITTDGVASSKGSGEGNQVGTNGANVFVFIRSTSSGSPAIILDKAGSPQNVTVTNAAAVKFLSIAGMRQMAATTGQCINN